MATRPVVVVVICVGLFILIECLVPKAKALRTSNINDFRMEDQRTQKRRNYMLQRAMNNDVGSLDNVGVTYDVEPLEAGRNPDELSAFIVDYANMIDDVILMDKSVETRTRKRGNIKLEKYDNQAITDLPCSCKSSLDSEDLGDNVFPRRVYKRTCEKGNQQGCKAPYICKEIFHDIAILRRKTLSNAHLSKIELIPGHLNVSWIAELTPISVGCECKRDYTYTNLNS